MIRRFILALVISVVMIGCGNEDMINNIVHEDSSIEDAIILESEDIRQYNFLPHFHKAHNNPLSPMSEVKVRIFFGSDRGCDYGIRLFFTTRDVRFMFRTTLDESIDWVIEDWTADIKGVFYYVSDINYPKDCDGDNGIRIK